MLSENGGESLECECVGERMSNGEAGGYYTQVNRERSGGLKTGWLPEELYPGILQSVCFPKANAFPVTFTAYETFKLVLMIVSLHVSWGFLTDHALPPSRSSLIISPGLGGLTLLTAPVSRGCFWTAGDFQGLQETEAKVLIPIFTSLIYIDFFFEHLLILGPELEVVKKE